MKTIDQKTTMLAECEALGCCMVCGCGDLMMCGTGEEPDLCDERSLLLLRSKAMVAV